MNNSLSFINRSVIPTPTPTPTPTLNPNDFTTFVSGLIVGLLLFMILLIAIFIFLFRQNSKNRIIKKIGEVAEKRINSSLKAWSKQSKSIFINSSLYKYDDNKLFEIDSILITNRAIIVVEIKSMTGIIKGDGEVKDWKKVLGNQVFTFYNPILQNNRHIEHIIRIIKKKIPIISLVIFSNKVSELQISNIPKHVLLIQHKDLYTSLDTAQLALETKISYSDMQDLQKTIKSHRTNKLSDISLHRNQAREKAKKDN
ncbi:nuclease-related domain-containing protein [[Mycoplasma] mobile]|uniref:Expressed protein n=1 Tax=Mycoplasma mobile (strain ATCC 43663 / 163K / NCTC 11711) TaxID=267748 RepID=Q6KHC5_MYCM1|nr:nuclease-related domain-containing protein [[Mycoplasma] mobile]AAT28005.1 expressed protein [Mycoplasma mobile 163K]